VEEVKNVGFIRKSQEIEQKEGITINGNEIKFTSSFYTYFLNKELNRGITVMFTIFIIYFLFFLFTYFL
jgi:hypothetical protein